MLTHPAIKSNNAKNTRKYIVVGTYICINSLYISNSEIYLFFKKQIDYFIRDTYITLNSYCSVTLHETKQKK